MGKDLDKKAITTEMQGMQNISAFAWTA